MSCDTRHLDEFLPPSAAPGGWESLDDAVRVYLEMPNADRPNVWAAVKERREEPAFIEGVRAAMREND